MTERYLRTSRPSLAVFLFLLNIRYLSSGRIRVTAVHFDFVSRSCIVSS